MAPRKRAGSRISSGLYEQLQQRSEVLSEIRAAILGDSEYSVSPIVIEGMTGTGKTALLDAVFTLASDLGLRVGRARCDASESSAPFGVVRQLFSSMSHRTTVDEASNDGTSLARQVLRDGRGVTADPADVYQSLLTMLASIGGEPVILGIDDVEWADAMSAGWLRFLARRLEAASVHIVLTTQARRSSAPGVIDALVVDPATRRFVIHPLDLESTATMLRQRLGAGISSTVAVTAHRVTGGNPLLIARMLAALEDLGTAADSVTDDQIANVTSPVVAHSVLSRASSIAVPAVDLLEALAVLGTADLRVVAAVANMNGDVAGQLADALADAGVLGWSRPLDFVHSFERNSVYAEIPATRRARIHGHAARVLAALGEDEEQVVRHLAESDPMGDDWTASVLIDAALRLLGSGDIHRADQLLARADREPPPAPLRGEAARIRAHTDALLGRSSALARLRRAARLDADPAGLAETALDVLDLERDPSSSTALLEIARSAKDQLTRNSRTAVRLELAESVLLEPLAGLQSIDDSTLRRNDPDYAASVTARLVAAERAVSAAARMEITFGELVGTLEPLLTADLLRHDGPVHTAVVAASLCALVRVGRYEVADPLIRAAMTDAELAGQHVDAIAYALILAESMAMQGHLVGAERLLSSARYAADGDLGRSVAMERRWFAALREWRAHVPSSVTVLPVQTVGGLAALGASASLFLAENTARVKLLEEEWASALTLFDELASAAETFGVRNPAFAPWRAGRSAALAGLGRNLEGAAVANESLDLARRFGAPVTVAEALACVARFEPPDAQVVLLREAIELITGTAAELLRCNLLIDLGFAKHHAGDAIAARTAFRDGADHAARLGVTRLASVAGRGLLTCGARPRRLQMRGVESLTPAELRVARLAADDHTNGSIAELLFINMKTVESHLTRVYKKLGIADRAELREVLDASAADDAAVTEAG